MDTRNGQMRRVAGTMCGDPSGAAFDGSALTPCPWTEVADTTFVAAWSNTLSAPPAPPVTVTISGKPFVSDTAIDASNVNRIYGWNAPSMYWDGPLTTGD